MTSLQSCLVIIFLIFNYNQLSAQTLRDPVYNDVIEINDNNTKEIDAILDKKVYLYDDEGQRYLYYY